jgi:hypothetical protein
LGNASLDVQIDSGSNLGDKLVVLRNPGSNAIAGTFANLPEGKILVAGGRLWRISYTGAPTGHDIVLTGEEWVITITHIQLASDGSIIVTGSAEPNRTVVLARIFHS